MRKYYYTMIIKGYYLKSHDLLVLGKEFLKNLLVAFYKWIRHPNCSQQ